CIASSSYLLMAFRSVYLFFFFSSRRRHTRLVSDWSSDVCSSDHSGNLIVRFVLPDGKGKGWGCQVYGDWWKMYGTSFTTFPVSRSEERRVGKEWRCGWGREQ